MVVGPGRDLAGIAKVVFTIVVESLIAHRHKALELSRGRPGHFFVVEGHGRVNVSQIIAAVLAPEKATGLWSSQGWFSPCINVQKNQSVSAVPLDLRHQAAVKIIAAVVFKDGFPETVQGGECPTLIVVPQHG